MNIKKLLFTIVATLVMLINLPSNASSRRRRRRAPSTRNRPSRRFVVEAPRAPRKLSRAEKSARIRALEKKHQKIKAQQEAAHALYRKLLRQEGDIIEDIEALRGRPRSPELPVIEEEALRQTQDDREEEGERQKKKLREEVVTMEPEPAPRMIQEEKDAPPQAASVGQPLRAEDLAPIALTTTPPAEIEAHISRKTRNPQAKRRTSRLRPHPVRRIRPKTRRRTTRATRPRTAPRGRRFVLKEDPLGAIKDSIKSGASLAVLQEEMGFSDTKITKAAEQLTGSPKYRTKATRVLRQIRSSKNF